MCITTPSEAASPLSPWRRLTFLSDENGRISALRLPAEVNVPPDDL